MRDAFPTLRERIAETAFHEYLRQGGRSVEDIAAAAVRAADALIAALAGRKEPADG